MGKNLLLSLCDKKDKNHCGHFEAMTVSRTFDILQPKGVFT